MGKEPHGHTTKVTLDFSLKHGEEVALWMAEHGLTRPCPHEDHGPDGGAVATKLGAEVWIMLSGMVSTDMLSNIMAQRIAEEAGFI